MTAPGYAYYDAARTTPAQITQDYDLGPAVDGHYVLLRHLLHTHQIPHGIALEFGVGSGISTRLIAEHMPVLGFDSFQGLPEDWRDGFPAGSFACDPPDIPNAQYVVGLYDDTLPTYCWDGLRSIALVHIDCDLYSSTKTVLDNLPLRDLQGAVFVFDEWHGYEGAEEHEQRAWREFADRTGIRWTVIGHSFQQWGIRIA